MQTPMQTPTPAELVAFARDTAERAGAVAMRHFRTPLAIDAKADDSPVTLADRDTERAIRQAIAARFPGHAILGEEFGSEGATDGPLWVVDPIDGTRSFVAGQPTFGLLLAHLNAGRPVLGAVHMPALGETFIGVAGGEATLNGQRIRCRDVTSLDDAVLFLNEAERLQRIAPEAFAALGTRGRVRRLAYDCYPHASVAAGFVDAVIDCGLEPYDYLPLVALVEAAGGVITDWRGRPLGLNSDGRVVTAATQALHAELLALLAR